MELPNLDRLVLLIVDVQHGLDDAATGTARQPALRGERRGAARRLALARAPGRVRHDSTDPRSPLRPGQPGNACKELLTGTPDLLITNRSSAFSTERLTSTRGCASAISQGS